jgi:hypothetical protein
MYRPERGWDRLVQGINEDYEPATNRRRRLPGGIHRLEQLVLADVGQPELVSHRRPDGRLAEASTGEEHGRSTRVEGTQRGIKEQVGLPRAGFARQEVRLAAERPPH